MDNISSHFGYSIWLKIRLKIAENIWKNISCDKTLNNLWYNIADNILGDIGDNSFSYLNPSPKTLLKIKSQIKNQTYE